MAAAITTETLEAVEMMYPAKARFTQQIATVRRDLQVLDVRGRTQAA